MSEPRDPRFAELDAAIRTERPERRGRPRGRPRGSKTRPLWERLGEQADRMREYWLSHGSGCERRRRAIEKRLASENTVFHRPSIIPHSPSEPAPAPHGGGADAAAKRKQKGSFHEAETL